MLPVQIQGWKRGRSDAPSHRQTRHISPEKKKIEINFTVYQILAKSILGA